MAGKGQGGRKNTPKPCKVLKGTFRADRDNPVAPDPVAEGMLVPHDLLPAAVPHFELLRERMHGIGLNSATYTKTVALAAIRCAQIDECQKFLTEKGGTTYDSVTAKDGLMVRAYPQVAHMSEAMRHLQSLLSTLGLDPTSIGKVGATPKAAKSSEYAEFKHG